ncbi:MAG: class I SAM-dependent methyltransferase [Nitrospiraceae bacterium]|nr:class I SAM-dependent methyltransferase [Nitrospiraceae bacterium]
MEANTREIASDRRFGFGKNWTRFLSVLNEERIAAAEDSLKKILEAVDLEGMSFLDIGSGSGLFSLAARRLGARVHSFDYDPKSVSCAIELKKRFFPDDGDWTIEEGSALDEDYMKSLGVFDIVCSWGVLHHTGAMWQALENVSSLVSDGGKLFIAIYNDQGGWSLRWRKIKKIYNSLPSFLRMPYTAIVMGSREIKFISIALFKRQTGDYIRSWTGYGGSSRGMSRWYDMIDWVGGYPFEVAKPEDIFDFYRKRGFILERLKTSGGGIGCNEYVFRAPRNR